MKPLDPQSRRLLDEVSAGDLPPGDLQEQLWQRLAPRLSETLTPTAAAASQALGAKSSLLVGTGALLKLTVVGVLIGAGVMGARSMTTPRAAQMQPVSSRAAASGAAGVDDVAPAHGQVATAGQSDRDTASSRLIAETQLLARTQTALRGGQAALALRLIEEHGRDFPTGALAQERDAARVLSLCALKRWSEARRSQQQFLRAWPDSPMTERVQHACSAPKRALSDSDTSPEKRSRP